MNFIEKGSQIQNMSQKTGQVQAITTLCELGKDQKCDKPRTRSKHQTGNSDNMAW